MKFSLFFLNFLIGIKCSIRTGYLYSNYMGSFICRAPRKDSGGSQPVLFAVETSNDPKQTIKVIGLDNRSSKSFSLVPKSHGRFNLLKGNKCETVKNINYIKPKNCDGSAKQDFIWVPEHMFEKFVDQVSRNKQIEKDVRKYDKMSQKANNHKLKYLRRSIRDIKGNLRRRIKSTLTGPQSKYSADSCAENEMNGAPIGDKMLNQYLNYYRNQNKSVLNLSKPKFMTNSTGGGVPICQQNSKPECAQFEGLMKGSASVINDDFMRNLDSILSEFGLKNQDDNIPGKYQSSVKRSRSRGIFAKGEDSEDININKCKCKFECVKNPKNGLCFFKATYDGKLIPIMKNESCCKKSIVPDPCLTTTNLEKHLCELITRNDFGSFSRFLDQNCLGN